MSEVTQNLYLKLGTDTPNGLARAKAIEVGGEMQSEPTALINYSSAGSVYILGNEETARQAAVQLAQHAALDCTLITVGDTNDSPYIKLEAIPSNAGTKQTELAATLPGTITAIKGYLGNFDLILETPREKTTLRELLGNAGYGIDMILDLTNPGLVTSEIKPPGYFAAAKNDAVLQQALSEIPELIGDFEKPQYFHYNPDICAHSRSHITACTRCIDTCPTDAISSIGDTISVDANLCQGAGSCATACPTGAITYSYPRLNDNLQRLHSILSAYQDAGGRDALIMFHDASTGRAVLEKYAVQLPDNVIPIELEELGSMGMDGWLACLSYGAKAVVLLTTPQTPARVLKEIKAQQSYATAILKGMGLPVDAIQLMGDSNINNNSNSDVIAALVTPQSVRDIPAAEFYESSDKRKVIRAAVDHLYQYAPAPRPLVSLPTGAPFGEVWLDPQRCTLCMSCVWQCPGKALIAGGNQPQLKFVENDCVQCGLCARTCPEDAIGPSPRYLYNKEQRQSPRILYEEQPFLCITCGKAFASRSVIEQMTVKLKKHAMFQGEALQRIQMCEDCRVKDIYAAELKQPKENISEELT
ncbi:4Fe-4S binding protein [Kaarinaea lacus]